ncbi:MAG: MFS transporter [Eubacteriales bacterium]
MFGILLGLIYLSFISLGLPDGVLGAAWPVMSGQFGVSLAAMGPVTMIIAGGTIVSSLGSDWMTTRFGIHKITAVSVGMTALALLGFGLSPNYWALCLWAIPYGLGAGSVDAALNNYVALHFESRHMSWLHCMWGLGATLGPYIMGFALTSGAGFPMGYGWLFAIQAVLTVVLFSSKKFWNMDKTAESHQTIPRKVLNLKEIFQIRGVPQIAVTFFCFCALESSTGTWASSYLVEHHGMLPETAATFTAMFYLGITIGRFFCGFITMKYSDRQMIFGGAAVMAVGIAVLLFSASQTVAVAGILLVGLGSAPVYPCVIHSTPANFGAENAQSITGVQMASAYVGILVMPPLLGVLADATSMAIYPLFLGALLATMTIMYRLLLKKV